MIPFTTTSVDFAGPLFVKDNGLVTKSYICLFTCACIRAVHLELVSDMTIESFKLAFRRFVSRRGIPSTVYSDNALTFVSASHDIPKEMNIQINWKFIPKGGPWYGGWWERLVGITKTTLKKVLGKSQVNSDILRTTLIEIERVINDRPITYVSSDIRDPEPLTPSHLLQGRRLSQENNSDSEDNNLNLDFTEANKRFNHKVTLIEHFAKRWRMEYLTGLREFHRVAGDQSAHVKIGSVVQIMDNSPRMMWKLAVIDDLITGKME
ncbi:uncharacterized protein [Mytilus edulis]|uniref:uncharacterized protein n=1 Tax=Mytilus edulis TaxID=6550 RepID=UPI0039EE0213